MRQEAYPADSCEAAPRANKRQAKSRKKEKKKHQKRRNLQEEMTVEDVEKDATETVIYISSDSDDE